MAIFQTERDSVMREISNQNEEIYKLHNNNKTNVAKVNDEIDTIKNDLRTLKLQHEEIRKAVLEKMKEFDKSKKNLKAHTPKVNDEAAKKDLSTIASDVESMNRKMDHLSLKQQLFENVTYDGRILWKIDKVQHRIQQAIAGNVTALHSAPAFTEKYGYKFCGRLYLDGDGMGNRTHVSVFFVAMKSEYDNLLSWPMKKKVTFRLFNLQNRLNDITESFYADETSESFLKPQQEMNVAAGCPCFASKESLLYGGFIKDDSFFIEITVL
ncbi:TNF receptor-associated factor 3-like [Hydractinia symbiolongicarpus]|uniref:TNF receptor-associated factor 3-like n=1 Tax=Hydractinia symbiolongicarpus TaxID=13093 RepID=UPI00254B8C5F|nr:TNF receptor-associated factor 3-like [Hydractinia symbiolongicarpus]